MRAIRVFSLALLASTPTLALAQSVPDSIIVEVEGEAYIGWGASFGARFPPLGTHIGPLPIVPVQGTGETSPPSEGCDPLVNTAEIAGNIALVLRGTCSFVEKVLNAQAAGAEAVVIYNYNCASGCEGIVWMGGDCEPDVCSAPALSISNSSGRAILRELEFGPTDATLIPISVAVPVASEGGPSSDAVALHAVYPNPAARQTTVGLDVPTSQTARVAVFDLLGREVAVLHDGPLVAGEYPLSFDTAALPAGLYLIRATGSGYRATRKLVIAR